MKRQGYLFQKICHIENLKLAIKNASKGKSKRPDVKRVLSDVDGYALIMQNMLLNKKYQPMPCKIKEIYCNTSKKVREIYIPKFFPDLCMQWALMQVLEPVIMKGMYKFCCGSVPGRGIHYSKKYIRKWIDNDGKNTKYCLKLDITKFYPSINLCVLKNTFRKHIKDSNALWLIDTIIDVNDKGLPIGYFTSTWFSNFLLQDLDHLIKEKWGVKYYLRYADDMVLFGCNKKKLHKVRVYIEKYLNSIGLELKGNWQVFRVDKRAVDFLGYRFFRKYTLLRKNLALRIRRRVKKVWKKYKITFKDAAAIISYLGWTKHCNSYNYFQKHIKPYIQIELLKECIRNESKKWNTAITV